MSARSEPVRLHAAGSLKAALGEVTAEFSRREGLVVEQAYGPSGLLRDRIAEGEASHVFASANLQHPAALAAAGKAMTPLVFARNELCALTRPGLGVDGANLLDRMLDASVRLGTSTPGADPSGDYAWSLFEKADRLRPGARAALECRARKLTGGPDSPAPPTDRNVYGDLVSRGEADILLTYCTNAALACRDFPELTSVAVPAELSIGADYGLTVMRNAPSAAWRLAWFILSPDGQSILRRFGFGAPR
jgi:ABC-type molybdate transport system substrate-binding protein